MKIKYVLSACATLLLVLLAANPLMAAVIASSGFDADTEGWTLAGDGTNLTWQNSGGDPGGYINAVDQGLGNMWLFKAPAAYTGDQSAAFGGSLSYSLKLSGNNGWNPNGGDVFLVGDGGKRLAADSGPPPGTSWATYSVALDSSGGWRLNNLGGVAATDQEILDVLASLTSLEIRGEYVSGPDNADLDNVVLNDNKVGTVRILVTKEFNDNNPAEVDVNLTCTTGLPLSQDATISAGDPVVFVVEEITDFGNLECVVTETSGTTGYTPTYYANESAVSMDGCVFEGENGLDNTNIVLPGSTDLEERNACNIFNELNPVRVTVTKEWEFDSNTDGIDDKARIALTCINIPRINGLREETAGYRDTWTWWVNGDESNSVWVYPNWRGNASCTVEERIFDSAVESSGCENQLPLALGSSGVGCTITNTVFFEGIPTLSQYGMAIMALLMLGVGFIGFRRLI